MEDHDMAVAGEEEGDSLWPPSGGFDGKVAACIVVNVWGGWI